MSLPRLVGLGFLATVADAARTITVDLNAPWPTSALSPILETAEFFSEESTADFWRFAASLRGYANEFDAVDAGAYSEAAHEQLASKAVDLASALVSPLQLSALRLTLAVRSFAPLIEAHRSLAAVTAEACGSSAWAVLVPSGRVVCSPEDVTKATSTDSEWSGPSVDPIAESFRAGVDHEQADASDDVGEGAVEATMYGRLGTSSFWALHDALVSSRGISALRFRHGIPPPGASTATVLQGYGVNLDIKNMEYQNLDDGAVAGGGDATDAPAVSFEEGEEVGGFVFSTLLKRRPELGKGLSVLRQEMLDASEGGGDMKVWRMKDLGLQAAASISADKDPLRRLMAVAQDFPVHATPLSQVKVPKELRKEVEANAGSAYMNGGLLGGGGSTLLVNGRPVDIGQNTFNLFALLRTIRDETRQLAKLAMLRLPRATAMALLDLGTGGAPEEGSKSGEVRVDIVKNSKGSIAFLNNLEKDAQYKKWPRSLRQLLYPSWSLHTLSRNLYTFVLVVDPTSDAGLEALRAVEALHKNMYPVRFGVILTSKNAISDYRKGGGPYEAPSAGGSLDPAAVASVPDMVALFTEAKTAHSSAVAFSFLFEVATNLNKGFSCEEAIAAYAGAVSHATGSWTKSSFEAEARAALASLRAEGGANSLAVEALTNFTRFASSKGMPVNTYSVNGLLKQDLDLEQGLLTTLGAEQQQLQMMVHDGRLGDGRKGSDGLPPGKAKSVLSALMALPTVVDRYHPLVSVPPSDLMFLLPSEALSEGLGYVHPAGTRTSPKAASVIVVGDWGSATGLDRLSEALRYLSDGDGEADAKTTRLAAVLSPEATERAQPSTLALQAAFESVALSRDDAAVAFLSALVGGVRSGRSLDATLTAEAAAASGLGDLALATVHARISASPPGPFFNGGALIEREISLSKSANVVVANGRCVFLGEGEPFVSGDFGLLVGLELSRRAQRVVDIIAVAPAATADAVAEADWRSDAIAIGSAFLGQYTQVPREDVESSLEQISTKHTLLEFSPTAADGEASIGSVSVTVVLDPLTEAAQRVAPLLLVLRDELRVPLRVLLLPQLQISEFPLSKFYRYVVGSDVGAVAPKAEFNDLPRKHVLTLRIDAPEPWNVQSSKAAQDVDNLKCTESSCGDTPEAGDVTAIGYTLKSLLAAGQCFDVRERKPPNGLQLTLRRLGGSEAVDTLVMQNLGYFQFSAAPGVWDLSLAEGRGRELFEVLGGEGDEPVAVASQDFITTGFYDTNIPLRVQKQSGKEALALLEDATSLAEVEADAQGGVLSALGNMFGSGSKAATKSDDTIHVFSLATGHLYERFLKIMMLSAVKRASMHVKFWLFENYLSPTFKDSVDAMAKEYDFEVGYVTYKWPSWLRQQTSKQRIIWGYKILVSYVCD